jgi:hypothetical protein
MMPEREDGRHKPCPVTMEQKRRAAMWFFAFCALVSIALIYMGFFHGK